MDVKTAGHLNRQVQLPGTTHDGNSPYKRPPVSPPVGVRGFSQYHSDPVRAYIMAHGQPQQQQVTYGPTAAMYRDNSYQTERASAIESAAAQEQQQYGGRGEIEHSAAPPQQQPPQSYQQMTGRRRPSLLPPSSDYAGALSRDRHLESYSQYYERDLNAPTVISSHNYPMVMGGSMDNAHQEHMILKRPRLSIMPEPRADSHRQLGIDTDIKRVEAISPTLPPDDYHQESSPLRASRDDLLQQIGKVDREIAKVEIQIVKLKKKQQEIEMVAAKPDNAKSEVAETNALDTRHQSVAQIIYAENRKKAQDTHETLQKLGPKVELPLYNQPSDTVLYHQNKKNACLFKKCLVNHFKKRKHEKRAREKYLTETYTLLLQQWVKRVEKIENNSKKKAKESKAREFYEKQFPELKKQREDKERFSRVGTRIRSDAELEEIMDGLQEQELEDKKMRNYAVIPPILLDARQKKLMYHNENCLVEDPMAEYKERQLLNIWTKPEKDIFKEKYLQHPKNFGLISSYLEKKSVADCVQYYYLTKKNENYKQLLRKHSVRKKRFTKPQQATTQPPTNQPAGVMTRQGASTAPTEDSSKVISAGSNIANASGGGIGNPPTSGISSIGHGNNNGVANSNSANKEPTVDKEPHQPPEGSETNSEEQDGKDRETEKEGSKDDETSDEQSDENEGTTDSQGKHGGPHQCAVCKTQLEHYGQSRAVTKSSFHLYNLKEEEVTPDSRVCSTCRCRSVRSRYTHCPIVSCRTPKRKVKRLRPLPGKWLELPPEVKDVIINELQIPPEVTKCCSACFNRITRRLSSSVGGSGEPLLPPTADGADSSRWAEEEMEMAKRALREHGTNWTKIASAVGTKSETQCKNFYFNYRRKFGLDSLVQERRKSKGGSDKLDKDGKAPPTVTDEEESGETTSSCEEFNGPDRDSSDTTSAPSPVNKNMDEDLSGAAEKVRKDMSSVNKHRVEEVDLRNSFGDEPMLLQQTKGRSASRSSLKSNTDYDSSATVSADEGASQLDNEVPAVNSSAKMDKPRQPESAARLNSSGGQGLTPSLLDESRVKELLSQANLSRPDPSSKGSAVHLFGPREQQQHGGHKPPERSDLEPGEHIIKKTVRDLIDQAIDTSFPNGNPSRMGGSSSGHQLSSAIPNIQDILRISAKPSAMTGSRSRELQQQQHHQQQPHPPSQSEVPPPLQYISSSQGPGLHMATSQQQQQVQPSLMYAPPFHHHPQPPPLQQQHHAGAPTPPRLPQGCYPSQSASISMHREVLPAVSLYIPDSGAEQYKAEDLSMKKERPSPGGNDYSKAAGSSAAAGFRMSPSVPQKPAGHLPHHGGHHHPGERTLGAPPPAHSNQYSRHSDAPVNHLPEPPHRGDAYYTMRQSEPRTKSPSAFGPDRTPLLHVTHLPPGHPGGAQRVSSPPHLHYMSQGRSPPSSSSSGSVMIKAASGMKGGGGLPPPLVNVGGKHHHPSLSPKQDKPPPPHMSMLPSGLSGSITHGTPVNQPGMAMQHSAVPLTLPNTRYEFLRQLTPPHHAKEGGSITLGTPVLHESSSAQKRRTEGPSPAQQMTASEGGGGPPGGPLPQGPQCEPGPRGMIMLSEGGMPPRPVMYERGGGAMDQYYRRMSPPPPAGYPYGNFPYARPPFATESQISSRQTIMTDYYISQQMQVRRSSGDKDSRLSPRARDSSPQAMVMDHRMHPTMYPYPSQPGLPPGAYLHQDSRMARHPTSPIDMMDAPSNSSPGSGTQGPPPPPWSRGPRSSPSGMPPHSTPPPSQPRSVIRTASSTPSGMAPKGKMAGVIQSPKSSSPRSEMEAAYGGAIVNSSAPKGGAPSPRHIHAHGHDAFSALVDVAYAQTSSKDISKHHSTAHHMTMISHDPRPNLPMGAREDKMPEHHNKGGKFPDTHHIDPGRAGVMVMASAAQERHKFEMSGRSSTDNSMMEEARERKMRAMYQMEQEQQQQHFVRPDYSRMEAERILRYKMLGGQPSPREGAPDVDGSGEVTPQQSSMFPRGTAGGQSNVNNSGYHDQRRASSPPQDLQNSRRASSSLEAYSAYAARGATTFRQMGRDPSKLLFDSLEKDEPKDATVGGEKVQPSLTAANLIEAIISQQIDKGTTSPTRRQQPADKTAYHQQSPEAMGPDDQMSPYKKVAPRGNPSKATKEEIVVTIDDGPPSSSSGTTYADRPKSRGRTPQPGGGNNPSGSGLLPSSSQQQMNPKFTLKERIDAIITEDYQGVNLDPHMAAMQYGRGGGGQGPSRLYSPHGGPPQEHADGRLPSPMGTSLHPPQRGKSPDDDSTTQHTYSWKLRRALQQEKEPQHQPRGSPPAGTSRSRIPGSVSPLPHRSVPQQPGGHLAPDERQIIRIAQSASPRPSDAMKAPGGGHPPPLSSEPRRGSPVYQVEPISPPSGLPPDGNPGEPSSTTQPPLPQSSWITNPNITSLLTARRMHQPPDSSDTPAAQAAMPRSQPIGLSPFENYVKHKIVEEMRKSSEEGQEQGDSMPSSQQPTGSPQRGGVCDDRTSFGAGPSASKYARGMDPSDPLSAGPFPGPASQYVPGAIYHSHSNAMLHQMEPLGGPAPSSSSRHGDALPRPPYKRTFEVMEASGSSERRPGQSSACRSRSISPSSSDAAHDAEEAMRSRMRLAGEGHAAPESSTERSLQLLPESSEGAARGNQQLSSSSDQVDVGGSGNNHVASSSPYGVSASGIQTSSSSSPDYPQSSRKESTSGNSVAEAQSSGVRGGTGGKAPWDDEVSSGKDDKGGGAEMSRMADSPQSGEMVIDESAAIDSATSSKLEHASPPPQEGISTSERGDDPYPSAAASSSSSSNGADVGQSVSSSHGSGGASSSYPNSGISSSTVSTPGAAFSGAAAGMVSSMGGVSTTYAYPFSALSVRSLAGASPTSPSAVGGANAPSSTQPPSQSLSGSSRSNSPVSASRGEPAPLMSSQYEPLSDED